MAGPRGDHNRAEFIDLVIAQAEAIARVEGLRGLGMRRLAAAVGYAPNSIYSAIGDLDAIVLRVNARTLERLTARLGDAIRPGEKPAPTTLRLADAYLDFVAAQPNLWSLLFEHVLPSGHAQPVDLQAALTRATDLVDRVLEPLIPETTERAQAVAALWAALHGIASLNQSGKLAAVSSADPHRLARLLVGRFLAGLGERQV